LTDVLLCWHPVYVIGRILFPPSVSWWLPYGLIPVVLSLGSTWLFLRMAIRHLERTAKQ